MKFVLISDTHEQHRALGTLPDGDVLIHAGDFTMSGIRRIGGEFYDWFADQPHRHKILIAGNHDFGVTTPQFKRFHYLCDSGVTIDGFNIWGSPYTPRFGPWAFMEDRGAPIRAHWDMIPADTNILITHGPPMNILDRPCPTMQAVGCADLLATLPRLTALQLHVFGHIHGGRGIWWDAKSARESVLPVLLPHALRPSSPIFVNASVVDEQYKLVNKPIEIEVPWPRPETATP